MNSKWLLIESGIVAQQIITFTRLESSKVRVSSSQSNVVIQSSVKLPKGFGYILTWEFRVLINMLY